MPRPLIAGNWKMNGLRVPAVAELRALIRLAMKPARLRPEIVICPPATLLVELAAAVAKAKAKRRVALGGQDCHAAAAGAHTGDIGAEMLKDAGAAFVIVGHSERRANHGETDAAVRFKVVAVHRAGLTAIACVGETLAQRDAGSTLAVVGQQLAGSLPDNATAANTVVAYEPVWAIGTGRTPTPDDVAKVHAFIRAELAKRFKDAGDWRILYGGSVNAANAASLMTVANVDGALVGGASLTAAAFWPIVQAKA
jgi:triosephosphate isomerase (TIM)